MVKHVIIWTLKTEYSDSEKRAVPKRLKAVLKDLQAGSPE